MPFKNSFYTQNFPVELRPYQDIQYDQIAVVFAGQGAIAGNQPAQEFRQIHQLKKYLVIVDEFLTNKLKSKTSWYLTEPKKIIKSEYNIIQNLFLFSMNVAFFDFLCTHKTPSILTAHSFGEYAALVCSGAITFDKMLSFVYHREINSPKPSEIGTLIAANINLKDAKLFAEKFEIDIANINSPEQVVFAVSKNKCKEIFSEFKKNRIAYRNLTEVGRPYHSKLMNPLADNLVLFSETMDLKLNPLKYKFLSSVNGIIYPVDYVFCKSEFVHIISKQLTTQLDFVKNIQMIYDIGIRSFLEFSQQGIYKQFINKTISTKSDLISNQSFFEMSFIEKTKTNDTLFHLELEKNPLFKILTKHIAQVTGYEVVEIGINDYFQEDLRIDSIKKAEIIFKTLQDANVTIEESLTLAQLKKVGDVVKYLQNKKENPKQDILNQSYNQNDFNKYTIQQKRILISNHLLNANKKNSVHTCVLKDFNNTAEIENLLTKFWSTRLNENKNLVFDISHYDFLQKSKLQLDYLLRLVDIIKLHFPEKNLLSSDTLITCYSTNQELVDLPIVQFLRSIAIEYGLKFKWVQDCDQSLGVNDLDRLYFEEIYDHLKLSNQEWSTLHYSIFETKYVPNEFYEKNPKNVLIIGGLKGLCFELLLKQKIFHNSNLYIIGRTRETDSEIIHNLKSLTSAKVKANYFCCDFTNQSQVLSLKNQLAESNIDFIINSAGLERSEKLISKTSDQIQNEFNTKIIICDNLYTYFSGIPKLHFSSIVGLFGNPGQSIYSYANAWLADLPTRYKEQNSKVIFWPAIEQTGMTKNIGIFQKMKSTGIQFLNLNQATRYFEESIFDLYFNNSTTSILISHVKDLALMNYALIDWKKWAPVWGQIVDTNKIIYQLKLNPNDLTYLKNHKLENTMVYPASCGLSQLITYGARQLGSALRINNFKIHNMLMILANKDTYTQIQYFHSIENNLLSINYRMHTQLEHFSAHMTINEEDTKILNPLNLKIQNYLSKQVDLNTFYSLNCIDFGIKFQTFESLSYLQNANPHLSISIGVLKTKAIYYNGEFLSDRLISILECAFQTASMHGVVQGQRLGIPLSIDNIKVYNFNIQNATCIASSNKNINLNQDENMYFNIDIFNEQNELCISIHQLTLSPIRSHPTLPFHWKENNIENEL